MRKLAMNTWMVMGLAAASLWLTGTAAAQDPAGVEHCRTALDACVTAAQTPADIDVCSEQEARCIADAMQVSVPETVPIDTLILCATTAAECAITAPNLDSLNSCSWRFDQCVLGAIQDQLSCVERWTLCVANNVLLLPVCSLELLVCTD
jgi:hypothetical protein